MTARDDGAARVGGETARLVTAGVARLVTVGDLQDGQSVGFTLPDGSTQWVTLRKVWRYGDGSVTLEFKGREPGMWNFKDGNLLLPVKVSR